MFTAAACAPNDAPPDLARADSVISRWVAEERIPGAVLAVTHDGTVVHERAFGHAQLYAFGGGQYEEAAGLERLGLPIPMTVETVFDLASVTKVMATTMATMLLVERGLLDLDAPVSAYLPEFTGDGRDRVAIRHLLTHTSGLPQWVPTYYHASDASAAFAHVRSLPLRWPPGAERHYSDLGFMVLGELVARVSGRGLDAYLDEELYGRIGLERTGFRPTGVGELSTVAAPEVAATSHGNPFERRMVHDVDFGYRIEGDPNAWSEWRHRTLIGEVNDGNAFHAFGGVAGHAGLFAPAGELAVLLQLLLDRGRFGGERLISEGTLDAFLAAAVEGQALGWQLPEWTPRGSFGHTGFTGTFVLGVPSEGIGIVLLTNRQNVGVDAGTQYPDVGPLQRAVTGAILDAFENHPSEEP